MKGFDVVGDVHGCFDELCELLDKIGDSSDRKLIFVGDLIDRGPKQKECLRLVRDLVERNKALCIMGNHEYNAILKSLDLRIKKDLFELPFYDFIKTDRDFYNESIAWMKTLPLWLDFPSLGVVHACWNSRLMRLLASYLDSEHRVKNDSFFIDSCKDASGSCITKIADATEIILKGSELTLPEGEFFVDKDGKKRKEIRYKWWQNVTEATRYCDVALSVGDARITDKKIGQIKGWIGKAPPKHIIVGHYWLRSSSPDNVSLEDASFSDNVFCSDFSCVKKGRLAAIRVNLEKDSDIVKSVNVESVASRAI